MRAEQEQYGDDEGEEEDGGEEGDYGGYGEEADGAAGYQ